MGNDRVVWGVSSPLLVVAPPPPRIHPTAKTHEHAHVLTQIDQPTNRTAYYLDTTPKAQNWDSLYVQPAVVISRMEYMAPKTHQKKNKTKKQMPHTWAAVLVVGPWPQWLDPATRYLLLTDLPGTRFTSESPISYILLGMPHLRSLLACPP